MVLLMRISNPFASISIVCGLSRCIELFLPFGISSAGEIPRFYGNLNHILFMGCKIKSAGFGGWIWYLAGSFAQTGNSIIKTAGRNPVFITPRSIRQSALPALSYQFHPFIQGAPWNTFVAHNETSKCSKFLSPIHGVE